MKDAFGNDINVGDVVAYAVRRGSSMWLNRITVTEVCLDHIRGYDIDDVRMKLKNISKMSTVIGAASLTTPQAHQQCADPASF